MTRVCPQFGKVCYETLAEAQSAALALSARPCPRKKGKRAYPYYCDSCSAYHLTSVPPSEWKNRYKRRVTKGS